MRSEIKRMDVQKAIEDVKNRTLLKIPGDFGRLIYLASTRDYTTGRYHHDGLAFRFTEEVTGKALAACHQDVFGHLTSNTFENLVEELEIYFRSSHSQVSEVIQVWEKLQPYRVTIPMGCDPLFAELFISDIKIALAILRSRLQTRG